MKSKCVLIVVFAALMCRGGISTDDPTSLLRSEWGKGTVADFRKIAYKTIPLVFKNGGTAAVEKWCAELVDYPDFWKETETVYWMEAKASTLSFCLRMQFVEVSTNCWFAAAELLNRYRAFVMRRKGCCVKSRLKSDESPISFSRLSDSVMENRYGRQHDEKADCIGSCGACSLFCLVMPEVSCLARVNVQGGMHVYSVEFTCWNEF